MKEMVLNTSDKKEKESSEFLTLQESEMIKHNLFNISELLNTGLNSKVLDIIIRLIETGIHPRALSEVVYKMKQTLKASYVNKNMVE